MRWILAILFVVSFSASAAGLGSIFGDLVKKPTTPQPTPQPPAPKPQTPKSPTGK